MPPKSKKTKPNKAGASHKHKDVEPARGPKSRLCTNTNVHKNGFRTCDSLNTYFKPEEVQEIKTVLKSKDLSGIPYIIGAVILNKFETVKLLLQNGHNINEIGQNQTTALMWAVKCKHLEIIELLLTRGADPTIKNENGDNALILALENKLWDEHSLVSFWNTVKTITFIDVDYMGKNSRSMLHIAVGREWDHFADILIQEKAYVNATNNNGLTPLMLASFKTNAHLVSVLLEAGSDSLKEDISGHTALCYAISSTVRKNHDSDNCVLRMLVKELDNRGLTWSDYVKRKLDLLSSPNTKPTKSTHSAPDMMVHIIKYVIKNPCLGPVLLIEQDIFHKLVLATQKYIDDLKYLKTILSILKEVLECTVEHMNISETDLSSHFVDKSGPDMCLNVLKKYGNEASCSWVVPAAMGPLIRTCPVHDDGKMWIQRNLDDIQGFFDKFRDGLAVNGESGTALGPGRIARFEEILKDSKTSQNELYKSKSGVLSDENGKGDSKSNAKKSKRRTRALRAEINKVKVADLAERLNLNGLKLLEKKSSSHVSLNSKANNESANKSSNGEDFVAMGFPSHDRLDLSSLKDRLSFSDPRSFYEHISKSWQRFEQEHNHNKLDDVYSAHGYVYDPLLNFEPPKSDDGSMKSGHKSHETDEWFVDDYRENQIVDDLKKNLFDVPLEPPQGDSVGICFDQPISLYPDWKSRASSSDFAEPKKQDPQKITLLKRGENKPDMKSDHKHYDKFFGAQNPLDMALEYLSDLLQKIVAEYRSLWKKDGEKESLKSKKGQGDNFNKQSEDLPLPSLREIENEHIEHLQHEFDKLVECIKSASTAHVHECHVAIHKLEKILLTHKIRGKLIMIENRALEVVSINRTIDESIANISESDDCPLASYLEKFLNSKREKSAYHDDPIESETSDVSKTYPDTLYLIETNAVLSKKPLTPEEGQRSQIKRELDKQNTLKNAYHLIPSILAMCDNDEPIHQNNTASFFRSLSKSPVRILIGGKFPLVSNLWKFANFF